MNGTEHIVLSTRGGLVSLAKTNFRFENDNFAFSAIGITIQERKSALHNIYIP